MTKSTFFIEILSSYLYEEKIHTGLWDVAKTRIVKGISLNSESYNEKVDVVIDYLNKSTEPFQRVCEF
jgi:hypothetical protein